MCASAGARSESCIIANMFAWNLDLDERDLKQRDTTALVERRLTAVVRNALVENWTTHKQMAVCKYTRKILMPMTAIELALVMPSNLEEIVKYAAKGYDAFMEGRKARLGRKSRSLS